MEDWGGSRVIACQRTMETGSRKNEIVPLLRDVFRDVNLSSLRSDSRKTRTDGGFRYINVIMERLLGRRLSVQERNDERIYDVRNLQTNINGRPVFPEWPSMINPVTISRKPF